MEVNTRDLLAGQILEIRLLLDRPPPVQLDVFLESSDARAVAVPRQVTFQKGEQQKTLQVRTGTERTQATEVTLQARIGTDRQRSVQTQVRVRPEKTVTPSRRGQR